ncbi:MAG: hypothetical protein KQH83_11755 [Actinobacteria bacterium]|nr:hypothetical protein [Actinomycetota bacterium]
MTRISIGTVVVILFALVSAACGDASTATTTTASSDTSMPAPETTPTSDSQTTTPATTDAATDGSSDASPQDWAGFESAFMTGCTVDLTVQQCECMFDEFQQRYEFDDFFDWAYDAAGDDPRIVEVVELCS